MKPQKSTGDGLDDLAAAIVFSSIIMFTAVMLALFSGDPDITDAIIHYLMKQ